MSEGLKELYIDELKDLYELDDSLHTYPPMNRYRMDSKYLSSVLLYG